MNGIKLDSDKKKTVISGFYFVGNVTPLKYLEDMMKAVVLRFTKNYFRDLAGGPVVKTPC